MEVRVRLFAGLRERAGTDEVALELPEGAVVRDALEQMQALTDGVPVVLAVNQEYAGAEEPLHPGRRARPDPAGLGRLGRRRACPRDHRGAGARPAAASGSAIPAPARWSRSWA